MLKLSSNLTDLACGVLLDRAATVIAEHVSMHIGDALTEAGE